MLIIMFLKIIEMISHQRTPILSEDMDHFQQIFARNVAKTFFFFLNKTFSQVSDVITTAISEIEKLKYFFVFF